ncbi:MAG: MJ0042-type zinc finger domain-containing protein [Candidatus Pelagibacterales bacterium]|jgi:predicted Zn finger-like uncharacterized protein|tara:strand:+ start:822 stop:1211 length:390 start_codon:yes stop_codon:yes gene_type:complete
MIISCPSCDAKYLVDPVQINIGRQVRCARCNFSWFQDNKNFEEEKSKIIINRNSKKSNSNSNKNLPAVYKEKKKIPSDLIVMAFFILFIFIVLSFNFFNEYVTRFYNSHYYDITVLKINIINFFKSIFN